MIALRGLLCLAVFVAGAIAAAAARAWLGTEVRHRSAGHGIVYYIATTVITVLMWDAVRFLMGW